MNYITCSSVFKNKSIQFGWSLNEYCRSNKIHFTLTANKKSISIYFYSLYIIYDDVLYNKKSISIYFYLLYIIYDKQWKNADASILFIFINNLENMWLSKNVCLFINENEKDVRICILFYHEINIYFTFLDLRFWFLI